MLGRIGGGRFALTRALFTARRISHPVRTDTYISAVSQKIDTKGSSLLLVDDVPENLALLVEVLERAGYEIYVATNGSDALQVTAKVKPDLVLMDVRMPGMDGFETCRRLKAQPDLASIPIVFLTAQPETDDLTAGFDAGGVDYLTKPFRNEEILVRVRTHLERAAQSVSLADLEVSSAAFEERIRVLMIDDQPLVGEAVRRLLADQEDIDFQFMSEASDIRRTVAKVNPSVLLLDLVMPGVDGFEVLAELRNHASTAQLPVIVLSSAEEGDRKSKAFASGASDYLVKVPDQLELVARIRHHTASHIRLLQRNQAYAELKQSQEALERSSAFIRRVFGRYVSDDIVDTLLDNPDRLDVGGVLRQVTILMSDLRGFTSLSERLPAAKVVAIINRYLGAMTEIIMQYDGTIEEFMGDGIKATFGTLGGAETPHAAQAVACAIAMQRAMEGVNSANIVEGLPEVEMGIGLHTGKAVVGNIGSQKRAKYGVFGRHVNLAARIESFTVGGQILISEFTHAEVTAPLSFRGELQIEPKGVQEPIAVYDVSSIGAPFDLQLPTVLDDPLRTLAPPLPLLVRILSQKDAGGSEYDGVFVEVGRRGARLRSEAPIAFLDDLRLFLENESGDREVYAKAVSIDDDAILVRFTSLPEVVQGVFGQL